MTEEDSEGEPEDTQTELLTEEKQDTKDTKDTKYTYESFGSKNIEDKTHVPSVLSVPFSNRSCGNCKNIHTNQCQHPLCSNGGDPNLIREDSSWAIDCAGWIPKQENEETKT